MKTIRIVIELTEEGDTMDLTTEVKGNPRPSTLEVLGVIELAKKQYVEERTLTAPPLIQAPDGAPWYAHLDGPCGPDCGHAPSQPASPTVG